MISILIRHPSLAVKNFAKNQEKYVRLLTNLVLILRAIVIKSLLNHLLQHELRWYNESMLHKKYIIFDFDGTLADSVPVLFTIIQEMAKEMGYERPITQADWDWVRDHELKEILGKFNIPLVKVPYLLLEGRNKMKKQMYSVPPCKGIIEELKELKKMGFELAILSSNSRDLIQEFILKNNLVELFDFVHSELNIFGKDTALLSLLKQFHMPLGESIYVGDEMRDIDACKKIKLDCISVTWGLNSAEALKQHGAQWVVAKPQEIIRLLNQ